MHNKILLDKTKDTKGTIKRLWKYLKKYKLQLALVVLFIVLAIFFNTISTLKLSPIIDNYIEPMLTAEDPSIYVSGLLKQLLVLGSFALLCSISMYLQYRTMVHVASYTVKDIRADVFKKIQKLSIKYFDQNAYGDLMSRITNDLDNVTNALNTTIDQLISGIINVLVALVLMIIINPTLTIITVLSIPLLLFTSFTIINKTKKQFKLQQDYLGDINGYIEEYISGQKVVKAFNKEEDVKKSFNIYNEKLRKGGFKAQAYSGAIMPITGSINNIVNAIIYVVAGIFAINGNITIGSILAFSRFKSSFSNPINEISQNIPTIQSGLAGAERTFEIIDEEIEFKDSYDKPDLKNVKGLVEFKNVNFGYEEDKVLKNISFTAKPGQMIAIVGPTGAGKTTIINLLTRFYEVDSGKISIDGQNIKDVNLASLRETLGIVLQDTVLFSDTVKENIRFGKLEATDKEIKKAAIVSKADNFISKLPERYDTLLNEDTSNISTGQKQLLNIARVILNNPKILILDEATSNVDTRTEVEIQEAMNKLMEGRTSIVIAHRLSTIRKADKILVIDDGRIKEEGTHKELIDKKGIYYNMYTGMFDKE